MSGAIGYTDVELVYVKALREIVGLTSTGESSYKFSDIYDVAAKALKTGAGMVEQREGTDIVIGRRDVLRAALGRLEAITEAARRSAVELKEAAGVK